MNAIKNKIQSSKGASITFALLIFLVCAVVSSVVIVAGTTAAGRMSQTAQTDQRFYAVSSAAELLTKAVDGKENAERTVTVRKVTETTEEYDVNGVKKAKPDGYTEPKAKTKKLVGDLTGKTEAELDAMTDVGAGYSILTSIAYALSYDEKKDEPPLVPATTELPDGKTPMTLQASGSIELPEGSTEEQKKAALAALTVQVYEHVDQNTGMLTFYVSKIAGAAGTNTNAYTLKLTFAADINTNTLSETIHGLPDPEKEYTTTDTMKKIETTTYKWTLIGVTKSAITES